MNNTVNYDIFNKENPKLSPMMRQYLATKEQYQDCILFYRLGDFYELFLDDAVVGSRELDLTLTGKDCSVEERAQMCGVPYHAYESYAQRLLEKGYKIAICEQSNTMINGIMKRDIVRVITPGTIIDTAMLKENVNTYIMCIYQNKNTISYACGDISTGDIMVGLYSGNDCLDYINDQIVRIAPQEIICNKQAKVLSCDLPCVIAGNKYKFSEYYEWAFNNVDAEQQVLKQYNLKSVKGYDFADQNCINAIGALLAYFKETQKRDLVHIKMPILIKDSQYMYIDTNTRRNLELEQTMHENTKYGSLLWVLDNTCTNGGSRMLRNWVRQPLQDKAEIDKRLDMVSTFVNNALLMENIKLSLSKVQDIERIVGKISYGNLNPKDCIALANSLKQIPSIKQSLDYCDNPYLLELSHNLVDCTPIAELISNTIAEEPPTLIKDGEFIKAGFNTELDKLRDMKKNALNYILAMQTQERETTGIKTLKISSNQVFGYYIEVGKAYTEQVPFRYVRKQTTANAERYITEELKKLEEDINTSQEQSIKLELEIFTALKSQLLENAKLLQNVATILSTIDCIYSLANVAKENDYVRPTIVLDNKINIDEGRHPVIEKLQKIDFISNDCMLDDNAQRTMILTGPNMAGKSTYMRQVALITLMAHIGSFVPAKSASICLVDRIFTRIGASDDLAVGQSTFMVEMIEVANILHYATNKSLIILDEVGRGTSTFDGLSIAWAVVEFLSKHLHAKTLFATHYHELMQLEGIIDGVKNYCISIKEIGGKLVFLRKIMRGSATRSYGVEVASLAGLPTEVIERAKTLMQELESNKQENVPQKESEIVDTLKEIDVNTLSPLTAFDTLVHLIEMAKK